MRDRELQRMVEEIDRDGQNLTDWELEFIGDMIDSPPKVFSPNQARTIEQIHEERMP